jgi:hypothetical protein
MTSTEHLLDVEWSSEKEVAAKLLPDLLLDVHPTGSATTKATTS